MSLVESNSTHTYFYDFEWCEIHRDTCYREKAHKPTIFGCYVDLKGFAMSEYLQAYALFYLLIIDK